MRLLQRGLVAAGAPTRLVEAGAGPAGGRLHQFRRLVDLVLLGGRGAPTSAVLYYGHSAASLLLLRVTTRARGIPLAVDVVEWPRAHPVSGAAARLNVACFSKLVFRVPDGVVVISSFLEDAARRRKVKRVLRLPVLVDPDRWRQVEPEQANRPFVVLCADLDGYLHDALTVVDALALLDASPDLLLVGRASPPTAARINERAEARGIAGQVHLQREFVSDERLLALYAGAAALLAPLSFDDRSRARFPSKLADYLLSERPVVTTAVGEAAAHLEHRATAYLAERDDATSFAEALRQALEDPNAASVGRAGRALAIGALDHRVHGLRLRTFLEGLRTRGGAGGARRG